MRNGPIKCVTEALRRKESDYQLSRGLALGDPEGADLADLDFVVVFSHLKWM